MLFIDISQIWIIVARDYTLTNNSSKVFIFMPFKAPISYQKKRNNKGIL